MTWTMETKRHSLASVGAKTRKKVSLDIPQIKVDSKLTIPIDYHLALTPFSMNPTSLEEYPDNIIDIIPMFIEAKTTRSFALPLYLKINDNLDLHTAIFTGLLLHKKQIKKYVHARDVSKQILWSVLQELNIPEEAKNLYLKELGMENYKPYIINAVELLEYFKPIQDRLYKLSNFQKIMTMLYNIGAMDSPFYLQKLGIVFDTKKPMTAEDKAIIEAYIVFSMLDNDELNRPLSPDYNTRIFYDILNDYYKLLHNKKYERLKKKIKYIKDMKNIKPYESISKLVSGTHLTDDSLKDNGILGTPTATLSLTELIAYYDNEIPDRIKDILMLNRAYTYEHTNEVIFNGRLLQNLDVKEVRAALYDAIKDSGINTNDVGMVRYSMMSEIFPIPNKDKLYKELYKLFKRIIEDRYILYKKMLEMNEEEFNKHLYENYLSKIDIDDDKEHRKLRELTRLIGSPLITLSNRYGKDKHLFTAYLVNSEKISKVYDSISKIQSSIQDGLNKIQFYDEVDTQIDNSIVDYTILLKHALAEKLIASKYYKDLSKKDKDAILGSVYSAYLMNNYHNIIAFLKFLDAYERYS